jgi:hypothetical protein
MKKLIALVIFAVILAPAPWGIAINTQTQQCAAFWGGDEYAVYQLPEGWQDYYPDKDDLIHTPIGTCTWEEDDWDGRAEKCCVELGYTYTGEKLGETRPGGLIFLMLTGLCLVTGVLGLLCVGGLVVLGLGVYFMRKWISKRRQQWA